MADLRTFLAEAGDAVWHVERPLCVVEEITAVQHRLGERKRYPVVVVAKPVLADGSLSALPVVTNLTASRELDGRSLGVSSPAKAAAELARRAAAPVGPIVVTADRAPVHEVVEEGDTIDLRKLPILRQHEGDLGHYITAGHCTTVDPDSGTDNVAIQRCCVRGPRRLTFYPYPGSHNARNVERWWARGEACPVAIWIGHHPRISMAVQAQLAYPQSHWGAAGGIAGEPIRLTPSRTFGARILVPADAEIVIEGYCPPNLLEADGPFAEYTGVMGVQTATPVIDVVCLTRRRDAYYHDIGAGLEDHLVPDNMAMEARIWSLVRPTSPNLVGVHVPFSGRRFNVYLQFKDPRLGEVRDALSAALSYRRIRTAIAVDEDIDLADDSAVLWALATRMTWGRDAFRADGLSHPNLDPSLPPGAATITKLAVDATLPPAPGPGLPKPFTPRLKVGEEALAKARAVLAGADTTEWPQE